MVLTRRAFFYLWQLNVGTDVYTKAVSPLIRNTFAVCAFFDLELDYCES